MESAPEPAVQLSVPLTVEAKAGATWARRIEGWRAMADVFVSYCREDQTRVENVVRALSAFGVNVWWDRSLEQNTDWGVVIQRQIDLSKAVLVCWSAAASKSKWVREEATEGERQQKYVGCMINPGGPAIGFTTLHNASLLDWEGEADHASFLGLLQGIGKRIGREELTQFAEVKTRALKNKEADRRRAIEAERMRAELGRERIAAEKRETDSLERRKQADQQRIKMRVFHRIVGGVAGWLIGSIPATIVSWFVSTPGTTYVDLSAAPGFVLLAFIALGSVIGVGYGSIVD